MTAKWFNSLDTNSILKFKLTFESFKLLTVLTRGGDCRLMLSFFISFLAQQSCERITKPFLLRLTRVCESTEGIETFKLKAEFELESKQTLSVKFDAKHQFWNLTQSGWSLLVSKNWCKFRKFIFHWHVTKTRQWKWLESRVKGQTVILQDFVRFFLIFWGKISWSNKEYFSKTRQIAHLTEMVKKEFVAKPDFHLTLTLLTHTTSNV